MCVYTLWLVALEVVGCVCTVELQSRAARSFFTLLLRNSYLVWKNQEGDVRDQDSLKVSLWLNLLSAIVLLSCSSIEKGFKMVCRKNILQILKKDTETSLKMAQQLNKINSNLIDANINDKKQMYKNRFLGLP